MKLLNFAIASIVDANTGNGYNRNFVEAFGSDNKAYQDRANVIRANSLKAVFSKIKASVVEFIETSKANARTRKNIQQLTQLNGHLLQDMGLTNVDLYDLKMGLITIDELHARREQYRNEQTARLQRSRSSSKRKLAATEVIELHQDDSELQKCA